jgi:hypothetical protein
VSAAAPGRLQQPASEPQPAAAPAAAAAGGAKKKKRSRKKKGKGTGDAVDLVPPGFIEPGEPEPAVANEPDEPEPELSEPKVSVAAEQLAALMAVPMAEWCEEQVLAWAELVELEPEARTALRIAFEDDGDIDGDELVAMTAKRLQKMLKKAGLDGDPEAAAEAVLALRDALLAPAAAAAAPSMHAHLSAGQNEQRHTAEAAATAAAAVEVAKTIAVAEAVLKAQEAAAKAAASCQICFEPYGGGVVPRMLVACGHTFCEGCLSKMLRCAPSTSSCVHWSVCDEPPHARV